MKTPLLALALIATPLLGGQAFAAETCSLPAGATAQPEQALQQKLEAEGWQIRQITLTGGCYRVFAVKTDGTRLTTAFNAATLEDVRIADEAQIDSFLSGLQGGRGGAGDDDDDDDDEEDDDDDDRRRRHHGDHDDDHEDDDD